MSERGKATIQRIVDIDPFALQLSFLLPGASLEALGDHKGALGGQHVDWANGAILLAVQSHLVRAGGKTILIDTCVGEHKQRPARAEWHNRASTRYLANLKACGCTPDDVDIVMCTHLHADHVGWNTRLENGQWVPTFPKARYLMSLREVEQRATEAAARPEANHGSYQDSVLPVLDRGAATFVDAGDEIVDGGTILALPGHAPGQIGLELREGDGMDVFCGDAIHSPVQVFRPEWSSAFCHDKAQAERTRRALLARAAGEDLRLIPAHLRGRIMRVREAAGDFVPVIEP
ncbi:MAG TPA: MBL fold metallo-hydrolase [Pseudolabrys sp.]|jgi:glyoxylase-like metal-dependent hydrolase (beta-lactamase superfamily II)|nr:MBL fold metallo-hydrolase [Pseudolabrys sp.]